jgi:hypothetical protein
MLLAGIQADPDWTPDPFDVAQGRGEQSRTTIKTFGGDALGVAALRPNRHFPKEVTKLTFQNERLLWRTNLI